MNGNYVGYVAGHDPLHGFLSGIMRDRLGVRERKPAFRVFRRKALRDGPTAARRRPKTFVSSPLGINQPGSDSTEAPSPRGRDPCGGPASVN